MYEFQNADNLAKLVEQQADIITLLEKQNSLLREQMQGMEMIIDQNKKIIENTREKEEETFEFEFGG